MLSQHIPLCVGGSLGKEVDIGVCVSELPPVVVVPEGVGTCVHSTTLCAEMEYSQCCTRKGDRPCYDRWG